MLMINKKGWLCEQYNKNFFTYFAEYQHIKGSALLTISTDDIGRYIVRMDAYRKNNLLPTIKFKPTFSYDRAKQNGLIAMINIEKIISEGY